MPTCDLFQVPTHASRWVGVYYANLLPEVIPDCLNGCDQIRVVRNNDKDVAVIDKTIQKHCSRDVNVRSLFLILNDSLTYRGSGGVGVTDRVDRKVYWIRREPSISRDIHGRQKSKGSDIDVLSLWCIGIVGKPYDPSGEILDPINRVTRQQHFAHSADIEPFEGSVSYSAIVEVESVDIHVGAHMPYQMKRPPEGGLLLPAPDAAGGVTLVLYTVLESCQAPRVNFRNSDRANSYATRLWPERITQNFVRQDLHHAAFRHIELTDALEPVARACAWRTMTESIT